MSSILNQSPYLKTSRSFPQDIKVLSFELNKAYIDIASAINYRTIGIFSTGRPVITGESWFVNNSQKQQTLRQVYTFTSAGNIPHGINIGRIDRFTRIYGTWFDGNLWYPLPFVDALLPNTEVIVNGIDATNIKIKKGAAATIVSGTVILEWLEPI